jgi:hypothetical protein
MESESALAASTDCEAKRLERLAYLKEMPTEADRRNKRSSMRSENPAL